MKFRDRQRQCSFESSNAEGSALELNLFFMCSMRSMVGGDRINSAVGKRNQDGFAVRGRAQRRVHLEIGVVLADVFVAQREMMRRHFTGHARPGSLAAAHCLE